MARDRASWSCALSEQVPALPRSDPLLRGCHARTDRAMSVEVSICGVFSNDLLATVRHRLAGFVDYGDALRLEETVYCREHEDVDAASARSNRRVRVKNARGPSTASSWFAQTPRRAGLDPSLTVVLAAQERPSGATRGGSPHGTESAAIRCNRVRRRRRSRSSSPGLRSWLPVRVLRFDGLSCVHQVLTMVCGRLGHFRHPQAQAVFDLQNRMALPPWSCVRLRVSAE